ncbi:sensor histidine kinase [Planobispora rosea]|uniref:sensor histidine kinase n=1 Tax=Planobispora rosea TaxID=35762 RepID=UPI00114CCC4D|nr:nitrate- and nitrite sensing domain-containing protein [Planobispora rosea]
MRSRLVALVLVPTVVGIVLGSMSVVSSLRRADHYGQVNETATLASRLGALAHELAFERDLSARFIASGRPEDGLAALNRQHRKVDEAATAAQEHMKLARDIVGQISAEEFQRIDNRLSEIDALRTAVTGTNLQAQPAVDIYSRPIADLLSLHDNISQGESDSPLIRSVTALRALARAKDEMSKERATLSIALQAGRFDTAGMDAAASARTQRDSELNVFRSEASLEQRQLYDDTVTGKKVDNAEFIRARALVLGQERDFLKNITTGRGTEASRWFDAATDTVNRMYSVERELLDFVIARSAALGEQERRNGLVSAGVIIALLLVVLLITAVMARSLVKPLRRLRTEALSIAGQRLPETVQSLRESGDVPSAEVAPIGVVSDDEIGEVARAFDEVHREAVRLAGEEASLRSNVNAMFVNLSRRSQTLVERQLALIESLEQGEQDENRLGSLFRLDHLATRMRRNSENLLVLAGQEPARRWSQPIPLIDVVRASLSEVESYERVELRISGGISVAGTCVNDVVHLIAELVENAISFSPRETKVIVSSNRIDGGGVMISVADLGIGMTSEELAQVNHRLAHPPVVDVSVSRRMGLFVVGRLALRHGIRVQLRQQDTGGLTAMVLLPEELLAAAGAGPVPGMPAAVQGGWGGPAPQAPPMPPPVPQSSGNWASVPSIPQGSSDWGQVTPPVLASPVTLDGGRPAFSSFEAAQQAFNSFDAGQSDSFHSGSLFSAGGGNAGQAPVDTPWPAQAPPPGAVPGWPSTFPPDSGSWADSSAGPPGRRGFGMEPEATGPLPVVPASHPLEEEREEFLPIFAAVESDWFRKADPPAHVPAPAARDEDAQETTTVQAPPRNAWSSPADAGWQAARAAQDPSLGGVTGAGLPKRVPKANLVPGSAVPASSPAPPPAPRPSVSPEAVRSRLSSFQRGVRQGRAVARGEVDEGHTYPAPGGSVEGNEDR